MSNSDVTIIIVSWNTRDILRDCLRSVYENAGPVDFHVIVVDNASTDGSVEMIQSEFGKVELVANSDNRGFAAANNQGMAMATGRYILLLNSDTIVLEGAIAKTVAFADTHVEAAVVGCQVLNSDRSLQASCFLFPSALNMLLSATYLYKIFPQSRLWGRERMTWWDKQDAREVDVISGCFMLVRCEAIEQVGRMDEAFFMYAEETDWCYRFRKAGWKNMYTPGGQIIHLGGASSRQAASKMRLQLSGSILYFLKKHRSRLEYTLGCLLTALSFMVRLPFWLMRAGLSRQSRSESWRVVRTYAAGAIGSFQGYRALYIVKQVGSPGSAPSKAMASHMGK